MEDRKEENAREDGEDAPERICPACGAETRQEKCKVVCRSERCVYRIVYNCSEF